MQIKFSLTGGWSPGKVFEVDTDTLPVEQKKHLEDLVNHSGVLTSTGYADSDLRDGEELFFELTTEAGVHHWQWYSLSYPQEPSALLELLDYCRTRCK